jgi:hypothetical protein
MNLGSGRSRKTAKFQAWRIFPLFGAGCLAAALPFVHARAEGGAGRFVTAAPDSVLVGEEGSPQQPYSQIPPQSQSFDGLLIDEAPGVLAGEDAASNPVTMPFDAPIGDGGLESVAVGCDSWWWPRGQACKPACPPCETPSLIERLHCMHQSSGRCWTGRMEALILWRNAPPDRPIFTTLNYGQQVLGPVAMNANQFQSDPLAAPRITLANLDSCGVGFEASYLYAGNFYSQRSLPYSPNGYAFAAPGIYHNTWGLSPAPPISSAQATLLAGLQSAEFNGRLPLGWGSTSFLSGVRWLQWWETWSMTDSFVNPTNPAITGTDTWRTSCSNNLFGYQIGLDSILLGSGSGMRIDGLVKAGAYYNALSQSSSYNYVTTAPFAFNKSLTVNGQGTGSFVGELGLTAVLPVHCNWDLRCGYFGLFLANMAQPTEQLSGQVLNQNPGSPVGTITATNTVVVQGISLGLEGRW